MISDYDDTHFCLKCHATILGLDNYVTHRKAGCAKSIQNMEEPLKSPSQVLHQDETFALKADDFFSSLELQSSAKKTTAQPTGGKSFSGILTRSKTTAVIQATKKEETQEVTASKSGKNAWIGEQAKLIKADDRSTLKREEVSLIRAYDESDEELDFDSEDESDEEDNHAPPKSYTGGKWKPSSPVHWTRPSTSEWQTPPPHHTKGKWKPQSPVLSSKDNYNVPPPTYTGSKWTPSKSVRNAYPDSPPPSHTKGKWKPGERPEIEDIGGDYDHPPPGHTKGKWKPGNMPISSGGKDFFPVGEADKYKSKGYYLHILYSCQTD